MARRTERSSEGEAPAARPASRRARRRWWIAGAIVAAVVVVAALAHRWTRQPGSCRACHEMRYDYDTWHRSSHNGVSCQACHTDYGLIRMVRNKLAARRPASPAPVPAPATRVSSSACLACHKKSTLPDEMRYHLLYITHGKHLDRGAQCTDCHDNVVHGSKGPFKNTPTMATCLVCHDGKKASNDCSLCHVRLGEIRPPLYNPAWVSHHEEDLRTTGKDRCLPCHTKSFCDSCHAVVPPHGPDWLQKHEEISPEQRKECATCHKTRPGQTESDFCIQCHRARRAHGRDFVDRHAAAYQAEPDTCRHCHQQSFCSDCHKIYTPHPPGWLKAHPRSAQADRQSCRTCHTDAFCEACHTGARPRSHTADWPTTHGAQAIRDASGCRACHTTQFCDKCHQQSPPSNHRSVNWIRSHGDSATATPASCKACHDPGYCASCHRGVTMPHPKDWVESHQRIGTRVAACKACHRQAFCDACHRGTKPVSHDAQWLSKHGPIAAKSSAECRRCHAETFCSACHGVPMPHPANIGTSHPALAAGSGGRYCGVCHKRSECAACHARSEPASHRSTDWRKTHGAAKDADGRCATCHKSSTCTQCHGLAMPHPDGWTMGPHGSEAQKSPALCARCHKPDDCMLCHKTAPPSSHEKAGFKKDHGAKPEAEPLCALCHPVSRAKKWDACQTCHRGVTMPHPDGYALQHKAEGSFKRDGPCLGCHQIADCKPCHADATVAGP